MSYTTNSQINFNEANREVLRITADGRLICGEGLSKEEATQEAAKLLIASFEEQIQEMVDARVTAAASQIPARSESKSPCLATD
jgi:hypothetical protein